MKRLLLIVIGAITLLSAYALDKVTMLTREGNLYEINLERINNYDVQYYVKNTHAKGYSAVENAYKRSVLQTSPKEDIFMIKYDNGNTIFFLENGSQVSRKSVKVQDGDDVLYLRDGQEIVVRELHLNGKEVTYKAPSRKNNEVYTMPTSQIFMIRHADGFCDVFGQKIKSKPVQQPQPNMMAENNKAAQTNQLAEVANQAAVETQTQAAVQTPVAQAVTAQQASQPQKSQTSSHSSNTSNTSAGLSLNVPKAAANTVGNVASSATNAAVSTASATATVAANTAANSTKANEEPSVQASAPAQAHPTVIPTSLSKAYGMFPEKIIDLVYKSNPYTLFKKNAVAEYVFIQNDKAIKYCGAVYLQQRIIDARVEDGLYNAYLQQEILDEHRQRPAHVDERYFESIFVTEIDTAGTFNWTHDPIRTQMVVDKRRGYASLIHNYLTPGPMQTSKIEITGSSHMNSMKGNKGHTGLFSLSNKPSTLLYDYTGLKVVGFDKVSTPCGVFDCVCISGNIPGMQANGNVKTAPTTVWLARGIGIVRCDVDVENNGKPIIMVLNNIYNNED